VRGISVLILPSLTVSQRSKPSRKGKEKFQVDPTPYGLFTPPTRQFCLVSTQFRRVRVGNAIGDATKLSCFVELNITADKTRQFCVVRVGGANNPLHAAESHVRHSEVTWKWRHLPGGTSLLMVSWFLRTAALLLTKIFCNSLVLIITSKCGLVMRSVVSVCVCLSYPYFNVWTLT